MARNQTAANLALLALLQAMLFIPSAASAAFQPTQSVAQLRAEIEARYKQRAAPSAVAKEALAAGVLARDLTSALLLAGMDGYTAVYTVVAAGGDVADAAIASLFASVCVSDVRAAALNAGADPAVVQRAIKDGPPSACIEVRAVGTPALTSARSGGGGAASRR